MTYVFCHHFLTIYEKTRQCHFKRMFTIKKKAIQKIYNENIMNECKYSADRLYCIDTMSERPSREYMISYYIYRVRLA